MFPSSYKIFKLISDLSSTGEKLSALEKEGYGKVTILVTLNDTDVRSCAGSHAAVVIPNSLHSNQPIPVMDAFLHLPLLHPGFQLSASSGRISSSNTRPLDLQVKG